MHLYRVKNKKVPVVLVKEGRAMGFSLFCDPREYDLTSSGLILLIQLRNKSFFLASLQD